MAASAPESAETTGQWRRSPGAPAQAVGSTDTDCRLPPWLFTRLALRCRTLRRHGCVCRCEDFATPPKPAVAAEAKREAFALLKALGRLRSSNVCPSAKGALRASTSPSPLCMRIAAGFHIAMPMRCETTSMAFVRRQRMRGNEAGGAKSAPPALLLRCRVEPSKSYGRLRPLIMWPCSCPAA